MPAPEFDTRLRGISLCAGSFYIDVDSHTSFSALSNCDDLAKMIELQLFTCDDAALMSAL